MARIRTIKPEFPHSESMGRISRDVRLCFIMLWTIADDSGRLRGSSRMLASLLFPYDDDAPGLMQRWLDELDAEGCIRQYQVDGCSYIEIAKWLSHQKIDKPSPSRFPPFDEASRSLANPREPSALDLGPRNGSRTSRTTSAPNEVSFDAAAGSWQIPEALKAKWTTAYPAISIERELAAAAAWLMANPKNRKSNYARFLGGWLSKSQDRAPRVAGAPEPKTHRTGAIEEIRAHQARQETPEQREAARRALEMARQAVRRA